MTSLVHTLPIVQLPIDISLRQLLPKNDITIDDSNKSIDSLSDRYEQQSRLIDDNGRRAALILKNAHDIFVRSDGLIVLWFGDKDSSLRTALVEYLTPQDITLILFLTEEQLWCWLNTNSLLRVASLIIQTNINLQDILRRINAYTNIRSIFIRCLTNELITLQRFSRSYVNIDGIFADDTRLLIKLIIDLALFSEETGDQQRENENNDFKVQRNYNRALSLCALARRL